MFGLVLPSRDLGVTGVCGRCIVVLLGFDVEHVAGSGYLAKCPDDELLSAGQASAAIAAGLRNAFVATKPGRCPSAILHVCSWIVRPSSSDPT